MGRKESIVLIRTEAAGVVIFSELPGYRWRRLMSLWYENCLARADTFRKRTELNIFCELRIC